MTSTAFAIFAAFPRPGCENSHAPLGARNLQMGRLEGGEHGEGGLGCCGFNHAHATAANT